MMQPGMKVKIEDIGPLAIVLDVRHREVELELDGEQFRIAKRLCKVVEK